MPMSQWIPKSQGFSMIEVLVAVVVLAVGLLGIAGLQAVGLKHNHSAYLRTQATFQITSIFDRMRANNASTVNYLSNNYNTTYFEMPIGTTVADQDLVTWKNELATLFPDGKGSVSCDVLNVCTVSVRWTDVQPDGSRANRFFAMTSQL